MNCPHLIRLVSAAALLAPLGASAGAVALFGGLNSVSTNGPAFTWSYNLELTADHEAGDDVMPAGPAVASQDLRHASFLTIFGFTGYESGICTSSSGRVCGARTLGATPTQVLPSDGAAVAPVAPVARDLPEPGSLALAGMALLLLGGRLRRTHSGGFPPSLRPAGARRPALSR